MGTICVEFNQLTDDKIGLVAAWLGQFWATYLKYGAHDVLSLIEGTYDINRICGVEFEA